MKKSKMVLLILVGLILLTPAYILIARASATGDFPAPEQAERVLITAPNGTGYTLLPSDSDYSVLFRLFDLSERVHRSDLPAESECAAYRLDFIDNALTETLSLYVNQKDFACYIKTSEGKVYRFSVPSVTIGSVLLWPSRLDWLDTSSGTSAPVFLYPDERFETQQKVAGIQLMSWAKLSDILFPAEFVKAEYTLYAEDTVIGTVRNPSSIAETNPTKVLMTVESKVSDEVSVVVSYYFYLQ